MQTNFRAHLASYPIGTGVGGGVSLGLKLPRRETHHLLLSTAKVKTGGAFHLLPILLHSVYEDICTITQLDTSKS